MRGRQLRTPEQQRQRWQADKRRRRNEGAAWAEGRAKAQAAIDERVETLAAELEHRRSTRTHWRSEWLPYCWRRR